MDKLKKKFKEFFTLPVLITILLLTILTINTLTTINILQNHIEYAGIQSIWDNVDNLIQSVNQTVNSDNARLTTIGHIIGKEKNLDSKEVKSVLSVFDSNGTISNLFLLLPNNKLIAQDGSYISDNVPLDFSEEVKKDSYISKKLDSFANINEPLLYHAVPVSQNGKVTGVLYGIIKLKDLNSFFNLSCFDGKAQMYLIEGSTGNFILDTLHDSLSTLDNLGGRTGKKHYNADKVNKSIRQGKTGLSIFMSRSAGEYLYFCHKTVGINDWRIALSVPESVIYQDMESINYTLFIFTLVKFSAIILYTIWILQYNVKEATARDLRLNHVNYMFDIQKTLFDAHQNPERMKEALEKIREKLQAEVAFFLVSEDNLQHKTYSWASSDVQISCLPSTPSNIETQLKKTGSYLTYDIESIKDDVPDAYKILLDDNIQSLMLNLVNDSNENAIGVLGAWNMSYKWEDARYLECLAINFFLAYRNIKNQETIGEMATIDMLTGLLNRNSHETALKRFIEGKETPVACIYIDVNGLHELNNSKGHSAGDEMLRFVGGSLQQYFGKKNTYRIGGDEFLAFIFDYSKEETNDRLKQFIERIESKDYHVSVGLKYKTDDCPIESMIAEAEQKMYQNKKEYYCRCGNSRIERH